jgi:UDP-glucose 4-epimerase
MEKLMVAKARAYGDTRTIFCGTRYGNVMGSRGSVIPFFIPQILTGAPITVTAPNMPRFMLSLDDAVDLVVYAFQNGGPGDIFVQKAPAATIETLARALKRLFNADNEIRVIGTRHGEKLYETLLTREEMANAQDMGDYYRVPSDVRDLNYSCYFTVGAVEVSRQEDYNSHNTQRLDEEGMIELLLRLPFVRDALETRKVVL